MTGRLSIKRITHDFSPCCFIFIIIQILFICGPAFSLEVSPVNNDINNKTEALEVKDTGLIFFSEVSVLVDTGFYSANSLSYTMFTNRAFSFDIIRYNKFVFSFFVDEERTFRATKTSKLDPWIIHYNMDYGSLRWEFKSGILSYFIDHQCSNIINQLDIGPRELRYYGMSLKWETCGMRPGRRNENIIFNNSTGVSFLNNFNYLITVSQCLANGYAEQFRYDMLIKGVFRYDISRINNLIPYVEGAAVAVIDEGYSRVRFDRMLETGLRVRLEKADITPFIGYIYKNDAETYNGPSLDAFLAGFRMEAMLYDHKAEPVTVADNGRFAFFPDVRFFCQYAKYLFNDDINFNHILIVEADLLRVEQLSIFINTGLLHNSPGRGGLWPHFMDTTYGGGIGYFFEDSGIVLETYYRYRSFDDGNHYRGYRQRCHTAGLEIKSRNMDLGYVNHGIDFTENAKMRWLNRFGWAVSGGRILKDWNYPYDLDLSLRLQWDIVKYHITVPYTALQARTLHGEKSMWEYCSETGVRLFNEPPFILFFQYFRRTREDLDNNLYRSQYTFGVRMEI